MHALFFNVDFSTPPKNNPPPGQIVTHFKEVLVFVFEWGILHFANETERIPPFRYEPTNNPPLLSQNFLQRQKLVGFQAHTRRSETDFSCSTKPPTTLLPGSHFQPNNFFPRTKPIRTLNPPPPFFPGNCATFPTFLACSSKLQSGTARASNKFCRAVHRLIVDANQKITRNPEKLARV